MRLPRRPAALVAASALVIGSLTACTSGDGSGSGEKTQIVIGTDLDTGSAADDAYGRALQLRVEQVNESGELGNYELVLRNQENRSDPTAALRNISTLADDATVAALVTGSCDECTVQAAKTIEEKKLPTITLAPSDNVVRTPEGAVRNYVFKVGPNSFDSTTAIVRELDNDGVKNTAVLYTDDQYYGKESFDYLSEALKGSKITRKRAASVAPTASDVSQAVQQVVGNDPAALVVLTNQNQATLAITSARAAGFKGKIYLDAAAGGDLFLPAEASTAAEDARLIFTQVLAIDDVIATSPGKSSRKQWFSDYTARYDTYSGSSAFAADAIDLIAAAVARFGNDREAIRQFLETAQADGLSGPIRLSPSNHSGLMPQALTVLAARSGRWRLAS